MWTSNLFSDTEIIAPNSLRSLPLVSYINNKNEMELILMKIEYTKQGDYYITNIVAPKI